MLEEVGGLDPSAIAQVRDEAWPDVRDADELHDVLHTLVALPDSVGEIPPFVGENSASLADQRARRRVSPGEWGAYFERLVNEGRASAAVVDGRHYWVAAEKSRSFKRLFPSASFERTLADVESGEVSRDDALLSLVTGWMSHIGPTSACQLGNLLGLVPSDVEKALLQMEASGTVLRGKFTSAAGARAGVPAPDASESAVHAGAEIEWCERRLLARIGPPRSIWSIP